MGSIHPNPEPMPKVPVPKASPGSVATTKRPPSNGLSLDQKAKLQHLQKLHKEDGDVTVQQKNGKTYFVLPGGKQLDAGYNGIPA